jgi:hypothetical protein
VSSEITKVFVTVEVVVPPSMVIALGRAVDYRGRVMGEGDVGCAVFGTHEEALVFGRLSGVQTDGIIVCSSD